MENKLLKKVTLVEMALAESCDQVSCGRCPKKQECDTYKNFTHIVNAATSNSSSEKLIRVNYDPDYKDDLHVSISKEDFDYLVEKSNGRR